MGANEVMDARILLDWTERDPIAVDQIEKIANIKDISGIIFADFGALDEAFITHAKAMGYQTLIIRLDRQDNHMVLDTQTLHLLLHALAEIKSAGLKVGIEAVFQSADIVRLDLWQLDYFVLPLRLYDLDKSKDLVVLITEFSNLIGHHGKKSSTTEMQHALYGDRIKSEFDCLVVRDMVLPVQIGIYAHEYGRTQQLQFSIRAYVPRHNYKAQNLAEIVSYDLLSDAIRYFAARAHIELVETLAEDIASHLLRHEKIMRVDVTIEKLELGAAGIGVEISRP